MVKGSAVDSPILPQEELHMQNPVILSANSTKSLAQNVVAEELVTTNDLAQMLGVDVKTIQRVVNSLDMNVERRGSSHTMVFTKAQATAIKIELQNHSKIARNGFDTLTVSNDLEGELLVKRAMAYQDRKIRELQRRAELAEKSLNRISDGTGCFSMNQTAKALKLPYGNIKLYERLRSEGILNSDNSPKQEQVNAGHFKVVVKFVNEKIGNKPVTLTTGRGLVYLAKRFNTQIDESVKADA